MADWAVFLQAVAMVAVCAVLLIFFVAAVCLLLEWLERR